MGLEPGRRCTAPPQALLRAGVKRPSGGVSTHSRRRACLSTRGPLVSCSGCKAPSSRASPSPTALPSRSGRRSAAAPWSALPTRAPPCPRPTHQPPNPREPCRSRPRKLLRAVTQVHIPRQEFKVLHFDFSYVLLGPIHSFPGLLLFLTIFSRSLWPSDPRGLPIPPRAAAGAQPHQPCGWSF